MNHTPIPFPVGPIIEQLRAKVSADRNGAPDWPTRFAAATALTRLLFANGSTPIACKQAPTSGTSIQSKSNCRSELGRD